jgi:hypothetical protein
MDEAGVVTLIASLLDAGVKLCCSTSLADGFNCSAWVTFA